MVKKVVAMFLTMCMAVSLLTGCGGNDSSVESISSVSESNADEGNADEGNADGEQFSVGKGTIDTIDVTNSVTADEFVVGLYMDPAGFQPFGATTDARQKTLPAVYEYLAVADKTQPDGFRGVIMKEYEQLDETTYRITIYDNIYDTNGNHITAEDVAWSYEACKEAAQNTKIAKMDSITVVDESTVDLKLTSDIVGALLNLVCGTVPIISRASYEASPDGMIFTPVGTKGYVLSDYTSGSSYTFTRTGEYWQEEVLTAASSVSNADNITFKIIPEAAQLSIALETGEIDASADLTTDEAARFIENEASGYVIHDYLDSNIQCLFFNGTPGGLMDNKELRQAVCYAIDAQGLVDGAYDGKGAVLNAFASALCVDYVADWDEEDYYGYDPEKAKELLAASGADLSGSKIRIMVENGTVNNKIGQIIQNYLLAAEINCELLIYESSLFATYKNDPEQWDIMLTTRISNDVVVSLPSFILDNRNSENHCTSNFVQDDALQALVETVLSTAGHTEENLKEYMEYVKDTAYVYGMTCSQKYIVTNDSVMGVCMDDRATIYYNACTFTDTINK